MKVARAFMQISSLVIFTFAADALRAELSPEVARVQARWAEINYQLPEGERADAMEDLLAQCDSLLAREAESAEALTWCGIVKSSYAGLAGPFSAMKYAKAARSDLEKAIAINGDVLSGSAYTSLGTLYYKVPGWPLGFGDKDKAREWLQRGLETNPNGIDSNFFYGDFLLDEGEVEEARQALQKAAKASPRPGREVADQGRREEIDSLLASIGEQHGKH